MIIEVKGRYYDLPRKVQAEPSPPMQTRMISVNGVPVNVLGPRPKWRMTSNQAVWLLLAVIALAVTWGALTPEPDRHLVPLFETGHHHK